MQLLHATPSSPPGIESKSGLRAWHEETAAVDELCDIVEDQQDGVLKGVGVGRGRLGQGGQLACWHTAAFGPWRSPCAPSTSRASSIPAHSEQLYVILHSPYLHVASKQGARTCYTNHCTRIKLCFICNQKDIQWGNIVCRGLRVSYPGMGPQQYQPLGSRWKGDPSSCIELIECANEGRTGNSCELLKA